MFLTGFMRFTLVNVSLGRCMCVHLAVGNNENEIEGLYLSHILSPETALLNNIRYSTVSFHWLSFTNGRQIYFLASCCISSDWSCTGLISFRKRYTFPPGLLLSLKTSSDFPGACLSEQTLCTETFPSAAFVILNRLQLEIEGPLGTGILDPE